MYRRTLLAVAGAIALLSASGATATAATFSNAASIAVPASGTQGPANPYPSAVSVSGLTGTVTKVTATLSAMNHTFSDDVDVLLVGPAGQKVVLMADSGAGENLVNTTLTFDDAAAGSLPDHTQISSGTYKPTIGTSRSFAQDGDPVPTNFPSPAPAGPYGSTLGAFNGTNPNGTWSLYVLDDTAADKGTISGGWSLNITTAAPADTTAPSASSSVSPAPAVTGPVSVGGVFYFGGQTLVTVNAADAGGVASIDCKIDGEATASRHFSPSTPGATTFSTTFDFNTAGARSYSCTATDMAGNTSTPTTGAFRIDPTAPTTGAGASPSTVSNGSITVTVTATDPAIGSGGTAAPGSGVASISMSVNGATPVVTSGSTASMTFTNPGTYTVTYTATDKVGNTSAPKTITVIVDATAPNLSYSGGTSRTVAPAGADSDAGPTILSGTASDNVGVTSVSVRIFSAGDSDVGFSQTYAASCPGCGNTSTSVSWSLNLSTLSPRPPSGVYNTTIIARDQAGNVRRIAGPSLTFL